MRVSKAASALVAGWAVLVLSAVSGLAAQTPSGREAPCQAMMAEKAKMMADMKVADQRLDDLVSAMNAASDTDKIAATAAVVSEMVTQRRAMHDSMVKMQEDMMGHMMAHMQAGAPSMAMCPMMKQMGSTKP